MYKFYNANPYGRNVSDCSVRAISLATGQSWEETYKQLADFAMKEGITFSEVEFIDDYLFDRYPRYCNFENMKLKDFLDLQLPGTWLITMRGHITCVIDGICYDTFDPTNRLIWCVYKVK